MNRRRKRVIGLAGSLRKGSHNRSVIRAARAHAPDDIEVIPFDDLADVPPFSEDLEVGGGPSSVRRLRDLVDAADGLLIATPEYNQSIPGVLKNVVDWLSRPGPAEVLDGKPVAVVGATTGPWGTRLAQKELRHVLTTTGSLVLPPPSIFVRNAEQVFDADGRLRDRHLADQLEAFLAAFARWIDRFGQAPSDATGPTSHG